jgi:multidrug efflux pump subunit AcrA (membrane-fusion protein)
MPPRRSALLPLALAVLVAACRSEPPAPPKAAEPPVVRDVAVAAVQPTDVVETQEVMGSVASRTTTPISSKIVGRIQALHAREGSQVNAGQLLVELDDQDIAAQVRRAEAGLAEAQAALVEVERAIAASAAARAAAEAQRDLAEKTLARYRRLLERKSVAPLEFDQVAARHTAASAEVDRAIAEGQAVQARRQQVLARIEGVRAEIAGVGAQRQYTRIHAPIAGIVTAKHAEVGAIAAPGAPLLTLEDSQRYWLEAMVPESRIAGLRPGQSLQVSVEAAGIAGTALVREILPAADPGTRTTLARLDLPPSPRLRSGQFGRVWIPAGRRQAIRVPHQAVVERGQLEGVYAVGPDGIARFRLVRTGAERDGEIEILSGLTAGEQIVVGGVEKVRDGVRIELRKP